jgi:hypothetical protein
VRRNLWPFDRFTTSTTYHVKRKHGAATSRAATHKGYRIERRDDGYLIPSIDRYSVFDDLRQAKRFIDFQLKHNPGGKKNAGLFARFMQGEKRFATKLGRRAGRGYMVLDSDNYPVHTGSDLTKREALKIAKAARADGEKVHLWRDNGKAKRRKKRNQSSILKPLSGGPRMTRAAQKRTVKQMLSMSPASLLIGNKARRGKKKNAGRRANPLEAAKKVYRKFHGRDAAKTLVITEPVHVHTHLSGIGDLQSLEIRHVSGRKKTILDFPKGTVLAQNEKRNQLFIRGGDQSVNLAVFGIEKPYHEQEILGEVLSVDYFTRKDHLRPEDGGTATYRHKFGRKKPTAIYSTIDKLISFAGGGYTIPDEGIDK